MDKVTQKARERIRRRVSQLTNGEFASARLLQPLFNFFRKNDIQAFLFGGTLRDFALNDRFTAPRDLDIVINDGLEDVAAFIAGQDSHNKTGGPLRSGIQRNRFGGLKVRLHGHVLDIWKIEDTWAFRRNLVDPPSFWRLPNTTFLNLDAIALELFPTASRRFRRLYEHNFFTGIEDKKLEVNLSENPFPQLCVVRAIFLTHSTGFSMGPKLSAYVSEAIKKVEPRSLELIQEYHYGTVRRSSRDLVEAVENIARNLSSSSGSAADAFVSEFDFNLDFGSEQKKSVNLNSQDADSGSSPNTKNPIQEQLSKRGFNEIFHRVFRQAAWIWASMKLGR